MPDGFSDGEDALGPYRLLRDAGRTLLGPGLAARRWIAINERTLANHVVYALDGCRGRARVRRVMAAAEAVANHEGGHVLPIESVTVCARRGVCLVAAYAGHNMGLCSVGDLIRQRGTGLAGAESRRAIVQVGCALSAMHERRMCDGALSIARLLVDRSGKIHVELAGLWAAVVGYSCNAETVRDDVRAMVRLACEMIDPGATGRRGEFAGWLADGLDPVGGYETAAAAMARLPDAASLAGGPAPAEPRVGVFRGLLDRIKGVVNAR